MAQIEESWCERKYSRTKVFSPCKRPAPQVVPLKPKPESAKESPEIRLTLPLGSTDDEKWKLRCEREFKSAVRQENETWQQLHERSCSERQAKLNALVLKHKQLALAGPSSPSRTAIVLTPQQCTALVAKKTLQKKACRPAKRLDLRSKILRSLSKCN